jgi:hypothetical protein
MRRNNQTDPAKLALYARILLWICPPVSAYRLSAAYLKCDTAIAVIVPPYLLSSLTPEGAIIRRLAR